MPQGILRPSHSVLSPHLRSFTWFNSSPELAYLRRYSRTREWTSHHGWWGSWISSWTLQPSKQLPTTRRRTVLWRDSTKLSRTCFCRHRTRLGQVATICSLRLPRGTPSVNGIRTVRAPLWMAGTRTPGPAEERLGGGTYIQEGGERHRSVRARDARSTGAVQRTS